MGSKLSTFFGEILPTSYSAIGRCPRWVEKEILQYLRNDGGLSSIPVIVITAFGSSDSAIEAVRLGAYDFIAKPFDLDEISLTAERALAHSSLNRELAELRVKVGRNGTPPAGRLIGASGPMLEVFKMIGKVAETDSTVLICGESGSGKELVAEAIHNYSQRKNKTLRGYQLRRNAGKPA